MEKTGGIIDEPDVDPDEVYDLSGYTLIQFLILPFALPIIIILKLKDIIMTCFWVSKRWIDHRRSLHEDAARKRKSLFHRMKKTLGRWFREFR